MPRITKRLSPTYPSIQLVRRKGGGGGGRGGSSGKGSSGKGSSKSSSKGSSKHNSLTSSQTIHLSSDSGLGNKVAKSYSDGGGPHVTLSNSPFNGREAGGGKRSDIYGTSRYGSGYPYGYGGSYYVSSYPMPYYYWPVPVRDGYYGSSTYGYNEEKRPGGVTVTVPVKSVIAATNNTFYLLGDSTSAKATMDSLTRDCHVAPAEPNWTFVGFNSSMQVQPEEVTQWYRASTFALAIEGYNNSAALMSNMKDEHTAPLPLSADTPLPNWVNRTFLECVNRTIGESLPLVDPPRKHKLAPGAIAGIVIGSMIGAIVIFIAVVLLIDPFKRMISKTRFSFKWPKLRTKHKKIENRGAYAPVAEAKKTDHDVSSTPTDTSYSEKHADIKDEWISSSEKQEKESFTTSLMTPIDEEDDIAKYPPKRPFQEPKSTLDMEKQSISDPAYPYLGDKRF